MKHEKQKYVKAVDDVVVFKSVFRRYEIAGKKMTRNQYELFLNRAVENIVMSGFTVKSSLERLLEINGYADKQFMLSILLKLSEAYEDAIQKEGERVRDTNSPVNAVNLIEITNKHDIVNETIREYCETISNRYKLKKPFSNNAEVVVVDDTTEESSE